MKYIIKDDNRHISEDFVDVTHFQIMSENSKNSTIKD